MQKRSFAAFLLLATSLLAQATWTQTQPATVPTIRRDGAMAWDAANNRLLMYGGVQPTPSTLLGETWGYNGSWTQLNPATAGIARWGHRMVRNSNNNHLIVFGGRSPTLSGFADDTVEWTGSTWTTIPTPTAPSPRHLYAMCYDSVRNVVVLFGGRTTNESKNDTWEYDGITWTERFPLHSPSPRQDAAMVFDPGLNRTVLFGGREVDLDIVLGGTWLYDGNDWVNATPAVTPSPRFSMSVVFDSTRQRTVMYGGFDGTAMQTETYEFTGSDWNVVATANHPGNTSEAFYGYDPVRKKTVLFGGFGDAFLNDTWEFAGATGGTFSIYGSPCTPSEPGTLATLTGSVPTLGQALQLDIGNILNASDVVAWAFGTSNLAWQGLPLPQDLGLIGLSGCQLLAAPDFLDLTLVTANTSSYSLNVPSTQSLLNATIYTQGLLLSLTGPNLFVGTSAGGRIVLGN